jgi:hypothetical protein
MRGCQHERKRWAEVERLQSSHGTHGISCLQVGPKEEGLTPAALEECMVATVEVVTTAATPEVTGDGSSSEGGGGGRHSVRVS